MNFRTCTKCNKKLPETTENFRQRGERDGIPLFRARCRPCDREYNRQYQEKNREELLRKQREKYWANPEKERERCREFMREWREVGDNREIERQRQIELYYRDIEETRRKLRQRYRKTIHQQREWALESYYRRRGKVIARKRGKFGFNSGSVAAANHRAKKMGCKGRHTLKDLQQLYLKQDKCCYWCACDLKESGTHVDHIVPLVRDGRNDKSNLCITCPTCNHSKNDKMPDEWMKYLIEVIIPTL